MNASTSASTETPTTFRQRLRVQRGLKPEPDKVELLTPEPYDLQAEIIEHPAKRKVVCAGRRAGKTVMAGLMAINALREGKRVLLSSTSQEQSDAFWEYITEWLVPVYNEPSFYKNESRRIIKWNGGRIRVKTGANPDALRGDRADLLVLDECAYLDANAWKQVGAPMLADTDGQAVFISTPMRRNWFFELYNHALNTDGWEAWNFTTEANIYLPSGALETLSSDMTESDYRQEILAEFLEGEGAVFRYVTERATASLLMPYEGRFVFGVDWAQKSDYTVVVVMDIASRQMVDYDRFNQQDWTLQRGRLATLYERWKPSAIWAESNSIGSPNIEALQREGLPVFGFETTAKSKPPLIESLVLAFDRDEIAIINDPIVTGEFMAYERQVSKTGRSQYSAPAGMHDDIVIATALAWYGIMAGTVSISEGTKRYA